MRKTLTCIALALALSGPLWAAPIHQLVQEGKLDSIKILIADDPSLLTLKDATGSTPLHLAAQYGQIETARYLLQQGVPIDIGDNENTTPLHIAIYQNQLEMAAFLLTQGADIKAQDANGMAALNWMMPRGTVDMVKLLIDHGAEVNHQTARGFSPLSNACAWGKLDWVRLYLEHGADPNIVDEDRRTPLNWAIWGKCQAIVEYLLAQGANPNCVGDDGEAPLVTALMDDNLEAANLLLDKGASVHVPPGQYSPLHVAARAGNVEMVKRLVALGADIHARSTSGETPLLSSVYSPTPEATAYLVSLGCAVNDQDEQGVSPLFRAAMMGSTGNAQVLIKNGADLTVRGKRYLLTPLHLAAIKGYGDLVDLLLAAGAYPNSKDKDGHTPLFYAVKYNFPAIAALLRDHGGRNDEAIEINDLRKRLNAPLEEGQACLWYTGHCGWAVKTRNHFLVFDYWQPGRLPDQPGLANGHIMPSEVAGQKVMVLVTHEHQDHFDSTIFSWKAPLLDLRYVFGISPERMARLRNRGYHDQPYTYIPVHETQTVDGVTITPIQANDAGQGFLVTVDGVTMYHAGDHAGWREGQEEGFKREIDFLGGKIKEVDVAFVNVTGCHVQDKVALNAGNRYTIDRLNPKVLIPTHGLDREWVYQEYADSLAADLPDLKVLTPQHRGDSFVYKDGMVLTATE
ncbi:MAG: hypothetical protein C4531_08910 [Desulfurivibrio sp.]|nr:MAG: hypothetical protein C4531_08910 [Desulfurivibrio sp.]